MAEYNGWSNYETWMVNLHLTNDEWSWRENERLARHFWGRAVATFAVALGALTRKEKAKRGLADALKENLEENVPELSGLWVDLIRSALAEVNWHEIAENMLSGMTEEADVEA